MNWKIPLFQLGLGAEEIEAVNKVLQSQWLTMGQLTSEFERCFAEFIGVKHAFAVNNCTAALHLAQVVLGIGPSDEVICPSLTFVATANTIKMSAATPAFADITSFYDWTISPEDIRKKISKRTKAIAVVHYAGYPCRMEAIGRIAKEHGLVIIEDCAHSPGASINDRMTGTWGEVGCFSFFSNKNMSTGEGGMLTTNRDDLAEKIRLMRSHGMTTQTLDRHKGHAFSYDVVACGYNYRTTEINSAIGIEQLKKLPSWNQKREYLVGLYRERLAGMPNLIVPFAQHAGISTYHIMPVLLPATVAREEVMAAMREKGIQTSIHYQPIHTFTAFAGSAAESLTLTEEVGRRELTLPLYPAMEEGDITLVVDALRKTLR